MLKSQAFTVGLCIGLTLGTLFVPVFDNAWCAWSGGEGQDQTHVKINSGSDQNPEPASARDSFSAVTQVLAQSEVKAQAEGQIQKSRAETPETPWRRPRYLSRELGLKKKLIVGILVDGEGESEHGAETVISNDRVSLLSGTLQRHVNKLVFFVAKTGTLGNENPAVTTKTTNMIFLKLDKSNGVNGSFAMAAGALEYFSRVFGNEYDFFFLARYNYYINGGLLIETVTNISVSEPVFWTQAQLPGVSSSSSRSSRGDDSGETSSRLHEYNGLLFSRAILSSIFGPCGSSESGHDSCAISALHQLMTKYQFNGKGSSSRDEAHETGRRLKISSVEAGSESEWGSSFLIGPLRNGAEFRRVHELICKKRKERINAEMSALQRKIRTIHLRTHYDSEKGLSWPFGFPMPSKPRTRHDVLQWVYFTPESIFYMSEHHVNNSLSGVDRLDVEDIVRSSEQLLSSSSDGSSKVKMNITLLHGYRRFDPGRGMEYILDFINDDSGLISRVEGLRPLLGRIELVPVPFVAEVGRITLLIPIMGSSARPRLNSVRRFLKCWAHDSTTTISDSKVNTMILFVFTSPMGLDLEARAGIESVKRVINEFNNQISTGTSLSVLSKVGYVVINTSEQEPKIAILDHLIKRKILKAESLVAILDETHIDFGDDLMNRVRMNTIRGVQVYSPVPFVEYVPELTDLHQLSSIDKSHRHHASSGTDATSEVEIHKTKGYFQHDDYGFLSFYVADFLAVRESFSSPPGVQRPTLTDLVDIFLLPRTDKNVIHVLRAPEPDLKIRFEYGRLNESLCSEHFDRCSKRLWASKEQLAKLIFSSGL